MRSSSGAAGRCRNRGHRGVGRVNWRLLAFVALVLGAIAGWLGGRSGVVHPVYADRMIPTRRSVM